MAEEESSFRVEPKKKSKKTKRKQTFTNFKMMTQEDQYEWFGRLLVQNGGVSSMEYADAFAVERFLELRNASRSLSKLANRVRSLVPTLKAGEDVCGAPSVLIVTGGARRATDFVKALRPLRVRLMKAFAKHIKLKEQIELAKTTCTPIAVGTPNRLEKLLSLSALSLARLELVLIDTHRNQKEFTIFNMKQTSDDLFSLVRKHLLPIFAAAKREEAGARANVRIGLL